MKETSKKIMLENFRKRKDFDACIYNKWIQVRKTICLEWEGRCGGAGVCFLRERMGMV
jgi:hypothetical protein